MCLCGYVDMKAGALKAKLYLFCKCMCMCVYTRVCTRDCGCPQGPDKGIRLPDIEITGSCELPTVGAEN